MSLLLPLQFHHLFPLDDEAVIHHTVPMVVTQEPVIELAPPLDHLEEVRQPVRGVVSIQLLLDAGGGAVGQDAVHPPVNPFQVPDRLLVFLLRGQFLGPPGDAFHPEHLPCPSLEPIFQFKIGGRRIKDPMYKTTVQEPVNIRKKLMILELVCCCKCDMWIQGNMYIR